MSPHETWALINADDQVVNHIVLHKDKDFEKNMAGQLAHWDCVRYVETDLNEDVIILDESPEIWTTHTEETGFVLPTIEQPVPEKEIIVRKKSELPADSWLLEENADKRPSDWVFPYWVKIVD